MPTRLSVLPPLPPSVYFRRPAAGLPFPFGEPGCAVYSMGRHAIWHGARALGLGPGDDVLMSAYHHGSEVQAILEAGMTPRFYDPTPTLEPPGEDVLDRLLTPSVKALVITHHIGIPQDSGRWRAWCDERDLLLIEDAAQSWMAASSDGPVGSLADMAIYCLYKTFGLPDGAALVVRQRTPTSPGGRGPLRVGRLARRHGRWLASRSAVAATAADRLARPRPYRPEDDFALGDVHTAPSAATMFLLRRLSGGSGAVDQRRRANYEALGDRLSDHVPDGFRVLPPRAAPHSLPLHVDRPAEFVSDIRTEGVRAFAFWSYPHPALSGPESYPNASGWRSRAVILPAHQELTDGDVRRIADVCTEALRRRS